MTEECKNQNEKDENDVIKREDFDNIINEDLRQHLKDELMTELNQSIYSAVPKAVRDLPYLVTCAYQVNASSTYVNIIFSVHVLLSMFTPCQIENAG